MQNGHQVGMGPVALCSKSQLGIEPPHHWGALEQALGPKAVQKQPHSGTPERWNLLPINLASRLGRSRAKPPREGNCQQVGMK